MADDTDDNYYAIIKCARKLAINSPSPRARPKNKIVKDKFKKLKPLSRVTGLLMRPQKDEAEAEAEAEASV